MSEKGPHIPPERPDSFPPLGWPPLHFSSHPTNTRSALPEDVYSIFGAYPSAGTAAACRVGFGAGGGPAGAFVALSLSCMPSGCTIDARSARFRTRVCTVRRVARVQTTLSRPPIASGIVRSGSRRENCTLQQAGGEAGRVAPDGDGPFGAAGLVRAFSARFLGLSSTSRVAERGGSPWEFGALWHVPPPSSKAHACRAPFAAGICVLVYSPPSKPRSRL